MHQSNCALSLSYSYSVDTYASLKCLVPVVDFPTRQCQKWQKNVEWRHVSPQSHTSLTSSYIFDVRYKATGHVTPFQIDMNEFQRLHTEQTNIQTEQMNIKKNPAK